MTNKPATIVSVGVGRVGIEIPAASGPHDAIVSTGERTPKALWHNADASEVARGLDTKPPIGLSDYYYDGWAAVKTLAKCGHVLGGIPSNHWRGGFAEHMAIMPPARPLSPHYGEPERLAYGQGFAAQRAGVMITPNHHGKADSWDGTERACPYSLNATGQATRRSAWFDGFNDAAEN